MASIRKKIWQTKRGEKSCWVVEWRDQNHKLRSKSFALRRGSDPEEHADAFKTQIENSRNTGAPTVVEERWTVHAWLENYRERASTVGIDGGKPVGTARAQQFTWFGKRINALIGTEKLEDLSESGLRRFRDDLLATGLDRRSAREVLNYFKSALADAKRSRLVLHNIWGDVKIVADATPRPVRAHDDVDDEDDGDEHLEMPTRTQMRHLLVTAKRLRDEPAEALGWEPNQDASWRKHYHSRGPRGWNVAQQAWRRAYVMVLLAALTGLRQGEIRGLYKRDVDLEAGVIRVRRAADKKNNIKSTKTDAGRRKVPIPPELVEELKRWLEIAPEGKLVFPTRTGRVMDRSNVYHKVWRRLLEHAGMEGCGLSFHSLRHYYASSIIAAGLGPLDVKTMMGHKKISTTYDLYGDLFPEDDSHRHAAAAAATQALLAS